MAVSDPVAKLKAKEFERRLSSIAPKIAGDPLPERAGEDTERDDRAELDAVRRELKAADANVAAVSGGEFHATIVCMTKEQRDVIVAHLMALGVPSAEGGRYIDGLALANALGLTLPAAKPTAIRPVKPDRKAVGVGVIGGYPEK